MNKFMAWDEENKEKLSWEDLIELDRVGDIFLTSLILDEEPNLILFKPTGKTDIHGNEIYYDFHVVKFLYDSGGRTQSCIGVFHFNKIGLYAEINIYGINNYAQWYDVKNMSDFEIIGNVKQNPELIGEGKS